MSLRSRRHLPPPQHLPHLVEALAPARLVPRRQEHDTHHLALRLAVAERHLMREQQDHARLEQHVVFEVLAPQLLLLLPLVLLLPLAMPLLLLLLLLLVGWLVS